MLSTRSNSYEHIEFGNTQEVALGKAIGDIDENVVKKAQIRRTIEAHLDKELRYMGRGIKVLSLFFIETVQAAVEQKAPITAHTLSPVLPTPPLWWRKRPFPTMMPRS